MLNYQRVLYSYGNDALFFAGQFKQNGPTIYTRWKALCIGERGTSICWQSTGMTKSYEQSTSTSQSGWCFTRLREISSVSFLQFPPFGRHFWPHLRSYSFIYFVSPSIFRLSLSYVILPDESQRVSSFCCFTPPVSIQPKKQALFHPIPLPYLQAIFHCRVPFCFPPGSAPESTCAVMRKTGRTVAPRCDSSVGFRWSSHDCKNHIITSYVCWLTKAPGKYHKL